MSRRRFKPKVVIEKKPLSKAEQALRLAKSNKRKINETREMGEGTSTLAAVALNATPTVRYINPGGMLGVKLPVKSFQVRGVVKQNLTSAIIDGYRMDLVLDRHPDGAAITPLLYLGTATPKLYEYKDFDRKERFKIIKTWSGYFNSNDGVASHRRINDYFRLNYMFESSAASQESNSVAEKNALYLVFWTDASANQPTIEFKSRIVFVREDSN